MTAYTMLSSESTFPHSQKVLEHILEDVLEDKRRNITRAHAARLYHFDSDAA